MQQQRVLTNRLHHAGGGRGGGVPWKRRGLTLIAYSGWKGVLKQRKLLDHEF